MTIELSLLKSFLAVVEHGNFLGAANAVGRSPSAITVQIRKLEDQLGHALFTRDARNTRLTKHGQTLLPHAKRMISMESNILSEFSKEQITGSVRLGVPDDVIERFPMRTLRQFNDDNPGITLIIEIGHTPALLKAVDDKSLDLAIITYAEGIKGVNTAEKIMNEPEVWAASANGIAWEKKPLPIALWDEGWAWYGAAVNILDTANIDYTIILQCENISGRKSAIAADLAIGPLPVSYLDEDVILAPGLQDLPKLPEYGLGLKVGQEPTPATDAAASHIRDYFRTKSVTP